MCILLGVTNESKGYWLYDMISKKIVISRDVVFEEDKKWEWDKSYEEHILLDLEWGDEEEHDELEKEIAYCNEEIDEAPPCNVSSEGSLDSSSSRESRNMRAPIWMRDLL